MDEPAQTPLELPADVIALVPMRNVVLFPHVLLPITVGRPKSIAAVLHAVQTKTLLGIVLQKNAQDDDPGLDALCTVGTVANVVRHEFGQWAAPSSGAQVGSGGANDYLLSQAARRALR